jgi:hypothetical protein
MNRIAGLVLVVVLAGSLRANGQQPPLPSNPDVIAALLEKRWSQKSIEDYCVPERRWNPLNQNLVPDGEKVWRGKLYEGRPMPFDRVFWYASISGNKLEYSLNVEKGKDFWNLEIGNEMTLRQPLKKPVER